MAKFPAKKKILFLWILCFHIFKMHNTFIDALNESELYFCKNLFFFFHILGSIFCGITSFSHGGSKNERFVKSISFSFKIFSIYFYYKFFYITIHFYCLLLIYTILKITILKTIFYKAALNIFFLVFKLKVKRTILRRNTI